jgi:predicted mannosyl-3-phosphoglycerate phosphatase (HAD superfamily)
MSIIKELSESNYEMINEFSKTIDGLHKLFDLLEKRIKLLENKTEILTDIIFKNIDIKENKNE